MNTTLDSPLPSIATGPYDPSFESLRTFECPDWFRDAKLGIWAHWGPQSVPKFGDWYARHMYVEGSDQYRYHWRTYGHPSQVGYKDIVRRWYAERFDPDAIMDQFIGAGAQYFFAQAVHHDNFDNWDSAHNPWNSVKVGPRKDIVGLWRQAAQKRGLPFGLSEHLAASFNWFATNKGSDKLGPYAGVPYDGSDPTNESLYYPNAEYSLENGWYTENEWFHRHWFDRMKDLIDKYQPDLLYSDGGVPFDIYGRSIVAHLYNTSAALHGANRAIYNQKDANPDVYTIGVLDIERGQLSEIAEHPWQTDTSVGDWYYNVKDVYKSPMEVIETLVDIVSKNGNLLINIPQLPDGTLDEECTYLLTQMGDWVKRNGEGIFGSRPWEKAAEGNAAVEGGAFKESRVVWTPSDFRFTKKRDTVYAYQMAGSEDGGACIRSLATDVSRRVGEVRKLGHGRVRFEQNTSGLNILPTDSDIHTEPQGYAVKFD